MVREKILNAVYSAINQVNQTLPLGDRLNASESQIIFDDRFRISSLALLNLLVLVEQEVEMVCSRCPSLFDVIHDAESKLSTVSDLVNYIDTFLKND